MIHDGIVRIPKIGQDANRRDELAVVSDGREARLSAAKVEPTMMSVLALGFYL